MSNTHQRHSAAERHVNIMNTFRTCSELVWKALVPKCIYVFTNSISDRNPCICVRWMHFLLSWFSLICCFLFFVQNKATLLLHSSFFGDCERINSSVDLDVPRNRCSQRQILCNGIVHVLHLKLKVPSIKHSSTDECKLKKQQQHDIGLERMNSPSI